MEQVVNELKQKSPQGGMDRKAVAKKEIIRAVLISETLL